MNCPYCQSQLEATDHQKIHHCPNCQGNWLAPHLVEKIDKQTVNQLEEKQPDQDIDPPDPLRCPICQDRLSLIRPDKSDTQIWACPQGHGNFFPHQHLKKLHKQKSSPQSSIKPQSIIGVLLPTLLVLSITAGLPLTIKYITNPQPQSQSAKASATISTPQITQIPPNSALITFNTSQPVTSQLQLYQNLPNKNNQPPLYTYTVSQEPQSQHRATLTDLNSNQVYYFTITITDSQNNTTTTEPQTITLNP